MIKMKRSTIRKLAFDWWKPPTLRIKISDWFYDVIDKLKYKLNLLCRSCGEDECTNIKGGLCGYCRAEEKDELCETCTNAAEDQWDPYDESQEYDYFEPEYEDIF